MKTGHQSKTKLNPVLRKDVKIAKHCRCKSCYHLINVSHT
nr:MAG TPA: hypothetical protein [Caudoviricetes sp.]DAW61129.1 MAG TPA: hypothetical protein [Caudoviricetes sp.]